jgi:ubiquinone/menaquinone biosynthesis C-methylase UbiE
LWTYNSKLDEPTRQQKAGKPFFHEVLDGEAESLPFTTSSFDTIVCTFTLCSVRSPEIALAEARRVLKPGGQFLFCEHGLAPDAAVATRRPLREHPELVDNVADAVRDVLSKYVTPNGVLMPAAVWIVLAHNG